MISGRALLAVVVVSGPRHAAQTLWIPGSSAEALTVPSRWEFAGHIRQDLKQEVKISSNRLTISLHHKVNNHCGVRPSAARRLFWHPSPGLTGDGKLPQLLKVRSSKVHNNVLLTAYRSCYCCGWS